MLNQQSAIIRRESAAQRTTAANQQSRAFTLIELLVVVAIIAVLISILVPSLKTAREVALSITCQTNMRAIGMANVIYAEEHESRFIVRTETIIPEPSGCWDQGTYDWCQMRWFDALLPYMGGDAFARSMSARDGAGQNASFNRKMGMYWCPKDRSRQWNSATRPTSFGVPSVVVSAFRSANACTGDALSVANDYHRFDKVRPGVVFLGEVGHNSWYHGFAAFCEENIAHAPPSAAWIAGYIYWHPSGLNYLFFDAHAEQLKHPPHALNTKSDAQHGSGTFEDGTDWTCGGLTDFLDRFYQGKCP